MYNSQNSNKMGFPKNKSSVTRADCQHLIKAVRDLPPQLVPIQSNYQKMYTSDAEKKLKAFKIFTQGTIIRQKKKRV